MPKPFQQEINGSVREFAQKMDPQLWKKSFAAGKKLARLLAEKKSAILALPQFANLLPKPRLRLEQQWDGLVELLTILVHSELSDPTQLASFDLGQFLEHTGERWLTQLAALSESLGQNSLSAMFAGLTPKTLKVKGDTAKMAWVAEGSSQPISQFSMIRMNGRWIPAGWGQAFVQIREWRGKLGQISAESFTLQSSEKLKTLAQAEQTMDALLATKTDEEFQQTLTQALGEPALGEWAELVRTLSGASLPPPASEVPPPTGTVPKNATDASSVTLIVGGATTTEDEDRIFAALQTAVPGDVDVQFDRTKRGLKVTVGPVGNWEEFRKRLSFATITKTDEKQRTLHITLKR